MILNSNFTLREIAGEKVIVQQGRQGVDMTKIISLNKSAEFLWNEFTNQNFSESDVAQALIREYEIDEQLATKDAHNWCEQMKELKLVLD